MKYNIFSSIAVVAAASVVVTACTPDEYDLGAKDLVSSDLVEGVAFSVSVDQETNTVTLKSLLGPEYTCLWNHPQGRSQSRELSLKMPFAGDYTVTYGVETRGGIVYGEPFTFTINNIKPELLEHPLWATISGGVDQEKTWVPDIDVAGGTYASIHFVGPLTFMGVDDCWDNITDGKSLPDGADSWSWAADYAGNGSWLFGSPSQPPYGEMTFDLKNGANVTVVDYNTGVTSKGTYLLDTENHTLALTDAPLLHDPGRDAIVTKWGQVTVLGLDEHTMQLGVIRDNDPSEGKCLLVYNYIEKGWVPEVEHGETEATDPDSYTGDANTDLTTTVTTSKTWSLDASAPYDWYYWDNAKAEWTSNGFKSLGDYSATNWAPVPIAKEVNAWNLVMTTTGDNKGQYTYTNQYGEQIEGKYTSEGQKIIFDQHITWWTGVMPSTSTEVDNGWKLEIAGAELTIVKKEGQTFWLGTPTKRNSKGTATEYACIKIKLADGAGIPARNVEVNNANLHYGDLEGKGTFRIEICNKYGSGTWDNPVVNYQDIYYDEKMVINFSVSGLGAFSDEIMGYIMHGSNTTTGYDMVEGVNTFMFKGDGTYEATITGMAAVDENLVLCIDVPNAQDYTTIGLNTELVDNTLAAAGVDVKINSIKIDGTEGSGSGSGTTPVQPTGISIDVNNDNLMYGDLEGKGYFRISFYNCYGGQEGAAAAVDPMEVFCEDRIEIKFTVSGLGTFATPCQAYVMSSAHNLWGAAEDNSNVFEFKGDGTYTAQVKGTCEPTTSLVYLIDVIDAQAQCPDLDLNKALENNRLPEVTVNVTSMKRY